MSTRQILELLRATDYDWAPYALQVDPRRDWPVREDGEFLTPFHYRLGTEVRRVALDQLATRIDITNP